MMEAERTTLIAKDLAVEWERIELLGHLLA